MGQTSLGRKRSTRIGLPLLCVALLTVLLLFRDTLLAWSLDDLSRIATAGASLCLLAVAAGAKRGLYSAGFLYLLALVLFHLSLSLLTTFGVPFEPKYQAYFDLWYRPGSYAVEAVYLSLLAATAFASAYTWSSVRLAGRASKPDRARRQPDPIWLARVGGTLIIAGAILFLGYVAITQPAMLLGGSYRDFDRLVGGSAPISAGMEMVAIGAAMVAAAPKSRARKTALIVLVVFAVIVLAMGSRTAVMYAALGAITAAARMHRMPRARVAVVGLLLAVVSVGIVAQVRDLASDSARPVSALNFTPVPALSEMGGSLRPVVETLSWRRSNNEPQYNGITYVAGPLRIYERVMGVERPESDERFASTLAANRVKGYNIGYSAVAEGFLNFGTLGVLGFFALLGWLLGRADNTWSENAFVAARVGVLIFALSYQVRQASNVVFTLILAGLIIIAVTRQIALTSSRRAELAVPRHVGTRR